MSLGEDALEPSFSTSVGNEDIETTWHELQNSSAVNQLQALLRQQSTKESEVSPSRGQKESPLRSLGYKETSLLTIQDCLPLITDHSQHIHKLDTELNLYKERLKLIYEERKEILDSQLTFLRKDLAEYQKKCADLEEQLRHKESLLVANISKSVGGICLKCAQHEAVISKTHNNVHMQTIERLTKERDDLMSVLVCIRSSMTDVQQREASAYKQVKRAVQMTEEANFEKNKALMQCKQLKSELERQTERLKKELASQQEKRAFEKEMMKKETEKEKEDMGSKMLILSQNIAQLEAKVEKAVREKISAVNQLEEIKNQLTSQEMDATKVCGEMRYQLNKTKLEKDEAEKEHREYRTKTKRNLEIKDQEIEILRSELSESKQHLEQEQQKAVKAGEECLKLTELLRESEHQLHLTRLEKDNIQQSFNNKAKAQALQAQQREQELTQKIQQMEAQHDKIENEQYSLMASQDTLLKKYKEEGNTIVKKLEEISQKSRSKIAQLSQEKKYLSDKLEKLQRRNNELEEQCVQHGRLHVLMKQRLKQLDEHSQATARQLAQLLSKQDQLLLERQSLTEEVGRLRSQLPSMPQSDC